MSSYFPISLCFVSSDLRVSVALCGAVAVVYPFEDGIFTKCLLDAQNGFLATAFFGYCLASALLLKLLFAVIGEKVELTDFFDFAFGILSFADEPVGRYGDATDQENRVDDAVK